MLVHRRQNRVVDKKALGQSLQVVLDVPVGRVCSATCNISCPVCGSRNCSCACSKSCSEISANLSSDPIVHPIEDKILALVYVLTKFSFLEPCWSCEGHLGLDGKLWKRPAVWFYCDDIVHLRLMTDAIDRLKIQRKLKHSWRITSTYTEDSNLDCTFSLEPDCRDLASVQLDNLHADIQVISEHLDDYVQQAAKLLKAHL